MKTILCLDSCIFGRDEHSDKCKWKANKDIRIQQYIIGYTNFFQYIDFFNTNNIDIVIIDNTCDSIDDFPDEIKNLIPSNVRVITKIKNDYGIVSASAGVIEHWLLGIHIWETYNYFIHLEIRMIVKDLYFFKEFLKYPMSIFAWQTRNKINNSIEDNELGVFYNKDPNFKINRYGRDNRNWRDKSNYNDFHGGLFSCSVPEFKHLIEHISLDDMNTYIPGLGVRPLEKILMCFAYDYLPQFKMIDRVYVQRFTGYSTMGLEDYA
tara:strand:- start:191 stop:985 length:795 start_codon:yes stop_codon:yes gene_type:complete